MKVLFLDQSGKLGGAELCLLDIAKSLRSTCKVLLFSDGAFVDALKAQKIPVSVLGERPIEFRKESSIRDGLTSSTQTVRLLSKVVKAAKDYDIIYANTPKALVIGALTSLISRKKLVYHLHDILSEEHFSATNRLIISKLSKLSDLAIANSFASKEAFIEAVGDDVNIEVVYNGFDVQKYVDSHSARNQLRQSLDVDDKFVIGHFSRLSPWKGQHVLIDALANCPNDVVVLLVGDALFGEDDYVQTLRRKVVEGNLEHRVKFLGFRHDVSQLMSACDLVAHTSTAPEPFGRVIVEAMLCARPVIAANAGGAVELIEQGRTGWLCSPNDSEQLTERISYIYNNRTYCQDIAKSAQRQAQQRFSLASINAQILDLLASVQSSNASEHSV